MKYGVSSHKGKVRNVNEDSYYVKVCSDNCGIFLVADGMGGHNSGETASKMAIEEISRFIEESYNSDMSENEIIKLIKNSVETANRNIFSSSKKNEQYYGMGTTVVLCLIMNNNTYFANVGDSRAYIIDNKIYQITTDHSVVEELIKNGTITHEEAKNHPQRNVITRALGGDIDIETDIIKIKNNKKYNILLCSDGLSNMLEDSEILRILDSEQEPQKAADNLVKAANSKGGTDNITVILIDMSS